MNKLSREKQVAVVASLVEGNSIRSTERMTGVHRDTIMRLLVRVGEGCQWLMDYKMRGISSRRIQVDEIWCFVGKKQRHLSQGDHPFQVGDKWTWVALDAYTKLVPTFHLGQRDLENARDFLFDLQSRLTNRIQLSSDALSAYVTASEEAFGSEVDYGQSVKFYEAERIGPGRYNPPHVTGAERTPIAGHPDEAHISTSFVERQNLTMRMSIRRFTRLTNAFSKKLENLKAGVALHFAHYNFVRIHKTLHVTPAMEAGVVSELWSLGDLLDRVNQE